VTLKGKGANIYTWCCGITDGVAFAPTTTNNYTLIGTDTNGCENSISVTVSVVELPTIPVISLNKSTLESNSIIGNQWYFNNSIIPNANNPSYNPQINGDYYVVVTANHCSSKPSNVISYSQTGFPEIETINVIWVFPNPTTGLVTIQIPLTSSEIKFELCDITGFNIEARQLKYNGKEFEIDLSKYPKGAYIVTIFSKTAKYQTKIVKL
jgi:hypothetical protein